MTFHDSPNDIPDPEVVPKPQRRQVPGTYQPGFEELQSGSWGQKPRHS
jgi:hypothetical protein